jgi:hypothetical protein
MIIYLCMQEDTRRHNRLIRFYESLGFTARAGAKVLYLTNYDESFRKVSNTYICVYKYDCINMQPMLQQHDWRDFMQRGTQLVNATDEKQTHVTIPSLFCIYITGANA